MQLNSCGLNKKFKKYLTSFVVSCAKVVVAFCLDRTRTGFTSSFLMPENNNKNKINKTLKPNRIAG